MFDTVITAEVTGLAFFECLVSSIILGAIISLIYSFRNSVSNTFMITLIVIPSIVQMVIMLVNDSVGTGVAVAGAFSLVRFRSAPGNGREIACIFLAMAVGIATGMGYLAFAFIFVIVIGIIMMAYALVTESTFGKGNGTYSSVASFISGKGTNVRKELRITVPESLDFGSAFDDLFRKYLKRCELTEVRTSNMGSLYKLRYEVVFIDPNEEKAFIDDLRCRNGNLEIACSRAEFSKAEL